MSFYDIMIMIGGEDMDLIRLTNVKKQYKNGVTAISDLNLSIKKGDFAFIIGGSGSGKSTLINKILYNYSDNDIEKRDQH